MLWGSNYATLVTVNDEELQTTAVYKPQRGERPLWDFPDGTLCYRETAGLYGFEGARLVSCAANHPA